MKILDLHTIAHTDSCTWYRRKRLTLPPDRLLHASLLLLPKQPADGRLDAFLLLVAVDGPESPVSGATCATRVCVCVCSAVTNGWLCQEGAEASRTLGRPPGCR